ncbi:hypothetical protein HELRODRAFT_161685 [Helobdella robusta]|uniref:WSC domain-containing protein n=1 Tax=Helobdella robusta TaxID=6412 RepID=T1ERS5_HELRO|nr:hypothetical protein HELRODRAFT_161685 [Helobdella robusta]ESO02418.1 hypothetical protein HELRODRAFT_161685 [Helobdella robusta]
MYQTIFSYSLFLIIFANLFSIAHAAINLKESYIGCYLNISSTKTVASVGSVNECSLECTDEINNMIALKSGKECNCIGRLDSAVASSQCDVLCANRDACGGRDSYSVYKSKPRKTHDDYASFETRQTDVILMTLPNTYTFEMCAHFCFETNCTFFQEIDTSNKCGCFQEHGTGSSYFTKLICDTCSSDGSKVCKCYHQGHEEKITIFATRFQYDFQRGVSTYSHCRNRIKGNYEITANCPDGCDPGWRGDSCRERDCSSDGGDCPVGMECIESTVNGNKYVECVCPPGKVRNKWYQCEVFRKNLALHKPPYYSSTYDEHDNPTMGAHYKIHLTDGNYDGYHISHILDAMPAWMAVDLLSLYCVGFIRAYNRINQMTEMLKRMDKFVVRLNETFDVSNREDIRDKVNLCGYGPEEAIQGGNPMIVVCENFTIFTRFVFIQPSDERMKDHHTALAELEVFEAGCDLFNGRCEEVEPCREEKKENLTVIHCNELPTTNYTLSVTHAAIDLKESYIGCYRNISSTKTVASVGSVNEYLLECNLEIINMIALKSGKECNCIGRLDSAVALSQCDVPCANRDACGGRDSYSVYKSKPRKTHDDYASFETRQTDVILMTLPNTYTFEMCAHFCFETNYTFFQKIDTLNRCSCFHEHGTGSSYFTRLICDS